MDSKLTNRIVAAVVVAVIVVLVKMAVYSLG